MYVGSCADVRPFTDICLNTRYRIKIVLIVWHFLANIYINIVDRHLMILGPSCPILVRDVLKIMGRVVLVRDFIGPSGLVRVVFGPSCL